MSEELKDEVKELFRMANKDIIFRGDDPCAVLLGLKQAIQPYINTRPSTESGEKRKWISVEKELPKDRALVWCFGRHVYDDDDTAVVHGGHFDADSEHVSSLRDMDEGHKGYTGFCEMWDGVSLVDVTHWCERIVDTPPEFPTKTEEDHERD